MEELAVSRLASPKEDQRYVEGQPGIFPTNSFQPKDTTRPSVRLLVATLRSVCWVTQKYLDGLLPRRTRETTANRFGSWSCFVILCDAGRGGLCAKHGREVNRHGHRRATSGGAGCIRSCEK